MCTCAHMHMRLQPAPRAHTSSAYLMCAMCHCARCVYVTCACERARACTCVSCKCTGVHYSYAVRICSAHMCMRARVPAAGTASSASVP